ncbi:ABC transporter, putative [Babesia ovata]|uniref:ABC transporter, putative n=1 Tax=Babesia ovata TaxID=189622 RepID=A0A2H6K993_9APIC|nr:ABC transporter, putative [Babesia ovata]GBE59529.1 ABC transporter, putative [Babesia ovata]
MRGRGGRAARGRCGRRGRREVGVRSDGEARQVRVGVRVGVLVGVGVRLGCSGVVGGGVVQCGQRAGQSHRLRCWAEVHGDAGNDVSVQVGSEAGVIYILSGLPALRQIAEEGKHIAETLRRAGINRQKAPQQRGCVDETEVQPRGEDGTEDGIAAVVPISEQVMAMRLHAIVYCGVRQPGEPSEDVPDGAGVSWLRGNAQVTDTQVIFQHVVECVQGLQSVMDEAADFSIVAGILVPQLGVDDAFGSNDEATAPEELPQGIVRIYVVMRPPICAAHSEPVYAAEDYISDCQEDHGALGGLGCVRLFRRVEQHAVVEGAVFSNERTQSFPDAIKQGAVGLSKALWPEGIHSVGKFVKFTKHLMVVAFLPS